VATKNDQKFRALLLGFGALFALQGLALVTLGRKRA